MVVNRSGGAKTSRGHRGVGRTGLRRAWVIGVVLALSGGCSTLELPGADGGGASVPLSIVVVPSSVELTMNNDQVQSQKFRAFGVFPAGARLDSGAGTLPAGVPDGAVELTDLVEWSVELSTLGSFEGNTFSTQVLDNGQKTPALHGGTSRILAKASGVIGTAQVKVKFNKNFIVTGTPASAPGQFGGTKSGGLAILYPPKNVVVPPNLGQMEFQYSKGSTANELFYLLFTGPMGTTRIYTSNIAHNLNIKQWTAIGMTNAGHDVTYRIYATTKNGGRVYQSQAQLLKVADTQVQGGLYFWVLSKAAAGEKPKYGSIYRYDFNNPKLSAEAYYTQQDAKDCIGCHSLSRGGEKIAFTLSGGNGDAAVFDVQQKAGIHKVGTYKADIQTFNPAGTEVIVVNQGTLYRRSVRTGELLETLDTGAGKATHPDWSPDGKSLVFVQVANADYHAGNIKDDVHFTNGSIAIMNRSSGRWGTPKILKKGGSGFNYYYPTFSPQGDWIMFNRSRGDSYSDPDANIYVIKPDGSKFQELGVNSLNQSNSWPRWSPFVQKYRGTTVYWLTFSSVRDYGFRLRNSKILNFDYKIPQIWMTSFDLNRAEKGQDPTSPPFWLPFQDVTTHNHIAQWTQRVVTVQ